jgi:hypothetical protein
VTNYAIRRGELEAAFFACVKFAVVDDGGADEVMRLFELALNCGFLLGG